MKVLNLLTSGETGGIESLCRDIGQYSDFNNTFCFLTHGGAIYEQMKSMGMNTYNLESLGGKFNLKKLKLLKRLAKEHDVIVVHHGDPFLKMYFIFLKYISGKRMITMVHSCYDDVHFVDYSRLKRMVCDEIFKKGLKISDAVVYVSEAGKNTYEKKFGKINKNSYIVYNGISPEKLKDGAANKLVQVAPYNITYIGRLAKIKGVDILLKATAIVNEKMKVRLSIIGDGMERKELENLARTLNIENIVTFYGQQVDVKPYLKNASLFVYPSTCQEVFGISIVEAMAFGIPCISNMVGGIPEVIENGKSGYLCKTFSENELAENICKILISDNTSIIEEGRKVARKFSILNTVEQLEEIYLD